MFIFWLRCTFCILNCFSLLCYTDFCIIFCFCLLQSSSTLCFFSLSIFSLFSISCCYIFISTSFLSSFDSLYFSLAYQSRILRSFILSLILGSLIKSSTDGLFFGSILSIHYITSCKSSEYLSGILSTLPAKIFQAKARWFPAVKGGKSETSS